jgi:anti-anti-sigma factor
MSGVEHMGSAGLGALVAAQQTLRGRDCALFLRLVPENITHLLEMSGLLNLFDIQDVEEYRQLFPKGAKTLFGGVSPTKPITDQF